MFRIANLLMVLALLVTAGVVYKVKYASTAEAERLAHLRAAIRTERDQISILRAEWARRTAPIYVQGLVQRHLDMQPLAPDNISMLDDLPEKPARNTDGIGGMIEALVDAPLTTSSVPPKPASGERATQGSSAPPAASALRSPSNPAPNATPKPAAPRSGVPSAARQAPAPLPVAQAMPQQAPAAPPPPPQNPFAALGALLPPGFLGTH
ncbi:hypothetical protein AZC_4545 [Azorhizobium caulinodans ORS 571]|uniref:Cell division protein FtsL n=5 Tax=Azorhizobium caulinodans TaxID=7 RepID=A8HZ66_AZOC5|nr:hypothetical protein [Azorhizobium caulinodans]BAF90543.1 hypothetical protein AZC_4545 [Azorhizobium caulinodans ORS 571]